MNVAEEVDEVEESIFEAAEDAVAANAVAEGAADAVADEQEHEMRVDVLGAQFGACGLMDQQNLLSQMARVSSVSRNSTCSCAQITIESAIKGP